MSLWVHSVDHSAFRSFEQAGWQKVFKHYHEAFAELTSQAIEPLLNAVRAGNGMRILDVATGPGYLAAAASQRGAHVVGVDFSSAMVASARRRYPDVEFREGDAEALPFPDGCFDAVVMNFGLLHLGRPEQALTEAHRVLNSTGRFAFTVWCKPDEAVGFGIVLDAVQKYGQSNVSLPSGPPFFRFSDSRESQRVLLAAGFSSAEFVKILQVWRLRSPDILFTFMEKGTVRTRGTLKAQSKETLNAIRKAVRDGAEVYGKGAGIE